jgi:uncharacterized DUF497 family protein
VQIEFDWDPAKAAINMAKHGVRFEEAMTVFRDSLARSMLDTDHDVYEERWVTLGQASTGHLLLVVHTWADINPDRSAVRIVSPRRPIRNEARQYHENPMP